MCRSQKDGGRRCPHSRRTGATLAAYNEQRRIARATRRQLAGMAEAAGDPALAQQIMLLSPDTAVAYARTHGVPVAEPSAVPPAEDAMTRRRNLLPAPGQVRQSWPVVMGTNQDGLEERKKLTGPLRKDAQDWVESLTDDERFAVRRYTGMKYETINKTFNQGGSLRDFSVGSRETVEDLDTALDRARSDTDQVVFRGYMVENIAPSKIHDWAQRTYPVGQQVEFPAFTSTTYDAGYAARVVEMGPGRDVPHSELTAEDDHKPSGFLLEIVTDRGAYVGDVSSFGDEEAERLLPRNSRFEVVDVTEETFERRKGKDPERFTVVKLIDVTDHDAVAAQHAAERAALTDEEMSA